jgi:hypothetical protein
MNRSRTALVALTLAALSVGGCTGRQRDATEGSVRGDVRDRLVEEGYLADPEADPVEVSEGDATDIGACVARTMFESTDEFTKEERNAATSAADGDVPDPDLVLKVDALVDDCYNEVVAGGSSSADDEAQTADDGSDAGADEETTTTEG